MARTLLKYSWSDIFLPSRYLTSHHFYVHCRYVDKARQCWLVNDGAADRSWSCGSGRRRELNRACRGSITQQAHAESASNPRPVLRSQCRDRSSLLQQRIHSPDVYPVVVDQVSPGHWYENTVTRLRARPQSTVPALVNPAPNSSFRRRPESRGAGTGKCSAGACPPLGWRRGLAESPVPPGRIKSQPRVFIPWCAGGSRDERLVRKQTPATDFVIPAKAGIQRGGERGM